MKKSTSQRISWTVPLRRPRRRPTHQHHPQTPPPLLRRFLRSPHPPQPHLPGTSSNTKIEEDFFEEYPSTRHNASLSPQQWSYEEIK
jgi:hypothetical protein